MMYGNILSTSIPNPENHSETFEPKPLSDLEYGAGNIAGLGKAVHIHTLILPALIIFKIRHIVGIIIGCCDSA
mgnify:CR=1 FL=1